MYKTFSFCVALLIGMAFLLTIVYLGLNAVEEGTQQIAGLSETKRALSLDQEERGLLITFADRDYLVPWKCYGNRFLNFIFP